MWPCGFQDIRVHTRTSDAESFGDIEIVAVCLVSIEYICISITGRHFYGDFPSKSLLFFLLFAKEQSLN